MNVPVEIRKYWWENSKNLINVPGTTISDSRVYPEEQQNLSLKCCQALEQKVC